LSLFTMFPTKILHVALFSPVQTTCHFQNRVLQYLVVTGRIVMKIFLKSMENIQVSFKSEKNNGYFICRLIYIFENISLNSSWSEKCVTDICRESQSTLLSVTFSENRAFYEMMWKNVVQPDTRQMTMPWGACALHAGNKATNTHSKYVIFIVCPLQQWLHGSARMLLHKYTVCFIAMVVLPLSQTVISDGNNSRTTHRLWVWTLWVIFRWTMTISLTISASYMGENKIKI
jgi:hypothetical protein